MALKFRELFRVGSSENLADQELVGLLEPGLEFEGIMTASTGMVRLNTHFKGEVRCSGAVVLADQGEMEGEIHCRFLSVAGKVKGTIYAADKVEIKANGVVIGDIYTASLILEPGGYLNGHCHMPNSVSQSQPMEQRQEV